MNIRQIGYNYGDFAKDKFLCYIDIDSEELTKRTIKNNINLSINADAKHFLNSFNKKYNKSFEHHDDFFQWCVEIKKKYSTKNEKYKSSNKINPYKFVMELSEYTKPSDTFITSNAMAAVAPMVAMPLKKGQRFLEVQARVQWAMAYHHLLGLLLATLKIEYSALKVMEVYK